MLFLPPNQQHQSTEGTNFFLILKQHYIKIRNSLQNTKYKKAKHYTRDDEQCAPWRRKVCVCSYADHRGTFTDLQGGSK